MGAADVEGAFRRDAVAGGLQAGGDIPRIAWIDECAIRRECGGARRQAVVPGSLQPEICGEVICGFAQHRNAAVQIIGGPGVTGFVGGMRGVIDRATDIGVLAKREIFDERGVHQAIIADIDRGKGLVAVDGTVIGDIDHAGDRAATVKSALRPGQQFDVAHIVLGVSLHFPRQRHAIHGNADDRVDRYPVLAGPDTPHEKMGRIA